MAQNTQNPYSDPSYYADTEQKYNIPPGLLYGMAGAESNWNPGTKPSRTGAEGLFQFEPGTAKQYGVNVNDPDSSKDGAGRFVHDLMQKYPDDLRKVIAGYNWGGGNLDKHGIENAPQETRRYFNDIVGRISKIQQPTSAQNPQYAQNTAVDPNAPQTMSDVYSAPAPAATPAPVNTSDAIINKGVPSDFDAQYEALQKQKSDQNAPPQNKSDKIISDNIPSDFDAQYDAIQKDKANQVQPSNAAIAGRGVTTGALSLANLPDLAEKTIEAPLFYGAAKLANGVGYGVQYLKGTPRDRMKQVIPDEAVNEALSPRGLLGDSVTAPVNAAFDKYVPSSVPQTRDQRLLADVSGSIGAGLTGGGGARGLIAGALGGGAAGVTRELGGSVPAQIAASVIGGGVPYAGQKLGQTVMGAGTQARRDAITENQAAFTNLGTTGTVGQTTDAWLPKTFEKYLSSAPAAAGTIADTAKNQARTIDNSVSNAVAKITDKNTSTLAGDEIKRGIIEDFIPQTKAEESRLYNVLDSKMPPSTVIPATNYKAALDKLTNIIPGAEAQSAELVNPKVLKLKNAFDKDTSIPSQIPETPATPGPAETPYITLKNLRSSIGEKLGTVELNPDIDRKTMNTIYAAMSEDMRGAAAGQGPDALDAFEKANAFSKAYHDKLDKVQSIITKEGGENIFAAATGQTKKGATVLKNVMNVLPDQDSKNAVTGAIIQRLGKAAAGQQDDTGNLFSMQSFLTNYANISPEAKKILFDEMPGTFKRDIENVAKAASLNRDYQNVFPNPSGTAPAAANIKNWGGLAAAVAWFGSTGDPSGLIAHGAGLAGNYGLAKMMTSPAFVRWLAVGVKRPGETLPIAIDRLEKTAKAQKDNEALEAARIMKQSIKTKD